MPRTDSNVESGQYRAEIRWTTHGVAHVHAEDWGSLGFGQGWACARDNAGTIADMIVKVRSERASYHGPGPEDSNLASDLGYLALGIMDRARALRDAQSPSTKAMVAGYSAGFNAWVAEARGGDQSLPSWCADATWIRPTDELDFYAYLVDATLLASGRNLVGLIGRAEAPGPNGPVEPSPLSALGSPIGASNGWALGRDATASGNGLIMANPHFPWYGEARFWECHLTIDGLVDVYGASLIGLPGVHIGTTRGVAWTHTFSAGSRFTLSSLTLSPTDPTRYRYGDEELTMTPTEHTVTVLSDDGELHDVTRTLWSSHHGPMVNMPLLGWSTGTAFTYRDANLTNTSMLEQFLGMDCATTLDEFKHVFSDAQGMPWANTLAADAAGDVWYTDASATPNLSSAAQQRFRDRLENDPIAALLFANRVPSFDGSNPDDSWVDDPAAPRPGVMAFERLPQLTRTDFVVNSNDSHWLTNPGEPLEGFSVLNGFERTARSLRTRQNLTVASRLTGTRSATVTGVLQEVLSGESLSATLLVDDVASRCRAAGTVTVGDQQVDLSPVADVLTEWNGTASLDAVGATLWREIMASFEPSAHRAAGVLFATHFDVDDPVDTPNTLTTPPADGEDPVITAVIAALDVLRTAGIDPDAPLSAVQWANFGDTHVSVPGGGEGEGLLNVVEPNGSLSTASLAPVPRAPQAIPGRTERTGIRRGGYQVTYGTSFLMVAEVTEDGPVGQALMVYGQSDDPDDPGHVTCLDAFTSGELHPICFTDAAIDADPNLSRRTVIG